MCVFVVYEWISGYMCLFVVYEWISGYMYVCRYVFMWVHSHL